MMERQIEIIVTVCLFLTGLSHIVQPRVWAEFFIQLRQRGEPASFTIAFMHLPLALLIVTFHNRWSGIPLVLTLIGWAWMLKSTLYFLFPKICLMSLSRVTVERAWVFGIGGWLLIGLGGVMTYSLLRN